MANTLKFYNRSFLPLFSAAIGAGTGVKGVYYDGLYFWIIDDKALTSDVEQYYLTNEGTLSLVSSFDFRASLAGLGGLFTYNQSTAICGDGMDLYIAYVVDSSDGEIPPTVTSRASIAKVTKQGNMLKEDLFGVNIQGAGIYNDLTWDGYYLYASTDTTLKQIQQFDVTNEQLVFSLTSVRTFAGLAFDGVNFITFRDASTGQGATIDRGGNFLTPQTVIGIQPQGADFGTEELGANGFAEFNDSEWICLVHQ